MADKLGEIADTQTALLDEGASAAGAVEGQAPPVDGASTESESPVGHEPSTPDINSVLAQLKEQVESGKIKLEDLPPELLPADARKVQSTFARKFEPIRRGAERVETSLKAAGVTLPEGKTVMDLLTEDGGNGFAELIDRTVSNAIAPVQREIDMGKLTTDIRATLDATVRDTPYVKEMLPEISRVIEANPDLTEFAGNLKALPYIIKGVGADLREQRVSREKAVVVAENVRLKKILSDAGLALRNGKETSKAGGSTPSGAGNGSDPKPKGLDNIAGVLFDQISAAARAN